MLTGNKIKKKLSYIGTTTMFTMRNLGFILAATLGLTISTLAGIIIVGNIASKIFPSLNSPFQNNANILMMLVAFAAGAAVFGGMVTNNSLINSADTLKGGLLAPKLDGVQSTPVVGEENRTRN